MTTTLLAEKTRDVTPEIAPRPYQWTVDSFYRALDAGVFEHPERLELIHGRIIEKMGQNPRHSSLTSRMARRLRTKMEPRFYVREEKPIHIASDGESIPDVSVMTGSEEDYEERHPTPADVALLVEVADTSASFDAGEKALLYAQAGVTDYWVVLLAAQAILVHRDPTPEGYKTITNVGPDGEVAPLAAPDAALSVRDLLHR